MKCSEIEFGTYNCAYNIMLPWLVIDPTEPDKPKEPKYVCIDKCLLPEILHLWEMGIKTTGCCCGHGKEEMAFIGVQPEYIEKMKSVGYRVFYNECRPGDEDSFEPFTFFKYFDEDDADMGFNWWDSQEV